MRTRGLSNLRRPVLIGRPLGMTQSLRFGISALDLSPSMYLRLHDASGSTLADASGNGKSATANNFSAWSFQAPGPLVNQTSLSLKFDGIGDYGTWPANTVGNVAHGASGVSFLMFVNPLLLPSGIDASGYCLISTRIGTSNGFYIALEKSGGLTQIRASGRSAAADSLQNFSATSAYIGGQWMMLGLVYDYVAKTIKIYRDGALLGTSGTLTWGSSTYVQDVATDLDGLGSFIGSPLDRFHYGNMAEVAIYPKVLTAQQIEHLYDTSGVT